MENSGKINRRPAREAVLRSLYAAEVGAASGIDPVFADIADHMGVKGELREFGHDLAFRTIDSIEKIDGILQKHTANWDLKRLSAIDRNILRMALAELLFFADMVPYKVVIDEAVELAKLYGTDDSGKFVNGVIDSVCRSEITKKGLKGSAGSGEL